MGEKWTGFVGGGGNGNVLKSVVMIVAQLYEYSKRY